MHMLFLASACLPFTAANASDSTCSTKLDYKVRPMDVTYEGKCKVRSSNGEHVLELSEVGCSQYCFQMQGWKGVTPDQCARKAGEIKTRRAKKTALENCAKLAANKEQNAHLEQEMKKRDPSLLQRFREWYDNQVKAQSGHY